jgi:hypothetical protein
MPRVSRSDRIYTAERRDARDCNGDQASARVVDEAQKKGGACLIAVC